MSGEEAVTDNHRPAFDCLVSTQQAVDALHNFGGALHRASRRHVDNCHNSTGIFIWNQTGWSNIHQEHQQGDAGYYTTDGQPRLVDETKCTFFISFQYIVIIDIECCMETADES